MNREAYGQRNQDRCWRALLRVVLSSGFVWDAYKEHHLTSTCQLRWRDANNSRAGMVDAHAIYLHDRCRGGAFTYLEAARMWGRVRDDVPRVLSMG